MFFILFIGVVIQVKQVHLDGFPFPDKTGSPDAQQTDGFFVPQLIEQHTGRLVEGFFPVGGGKQRGLVGHTLETAVFDLHRDGARQLPGFFQAAGDTAAQDQQGGFGFRAAGDVVGQGGGIADALGLRFLRDHRPVIDAVGVFPQKGAVAFQMGLDEAAVGPGQIADGENAQHM